MNRLFDSKTYQVTQPYQDSSFRTRTQHHVVRVIDGFENAGNRVFQRHVKAWEITGSAIYFHTLGRHVAHEIEGSHGERGVVHYNSAKQITQRPPYGVATTVFALFEVEVIQ